MWCLARLLPLMIGIHVPSDDQHWENFLQLMTIVDYVFAPVTSTDVLAYLKDLIEDYLISFKELYPNSSIIPKMHYLIHIPDWIRRYMYIRVHINACMLRWYTSKCRCGPVSQLRCMRFEAKHSYFKSLAHRVKNFRNIAKTMANRHQ